PDEASIVPDGLASCAQEFDRAEEDRSRSIIFATDNEVNGEPIFTLEEATQRVADREIDLYTFYPGAFECGPRCFEELESATEDQDGELYESSDPEAIRPIIRRPASCSPSSAWWGSWCSDGGPADAPRAHDAAVGDRPAVRRDADPVRGAAGAPSAPAPDVGAPPADGAAAAGRGAAPGHP